MAKLSHNFLTVSTEPEMLQVGKNKTSLTKFVLAENHQRKVGDKYEKTGTTFWQTNVWGDKAFDASQLQKGDVLDVSAEIRDGKDGQYVHFKAFTDDNSYTNKAGEEVSQTVLTLTDWDVRQFDR